jgi:hypothetical protein
VFLLFQKLENLGKKLAKTINITFLKRCKFQNIIPKGLCIKTPFNSGVLMMMEEVLEGVFEVSDIKPLSRTVMLHY